MPLPGHSVPVVALTRRQPMPYFTSCAAPKPVRNEFASTLTLICGRMFELWTVEPYDRAAIRSRPDDSPIPPSGVRRNPVLHEEYLPPRNRLACTILWAA